MKYFKTISLTVAAATALLAVIGSASASATTLEVGGVAKNSSVTVKMSLASGTSFLIKDSAGTTTDTCTTSETSFATESPYTGTEVSGAVQNFTFGNCSHTTVVIKKGWAIFKALSGTRSDWFSLGAEVTIVSTTFGASAICKTGLGTTLGEYTGVKSGKGTFDINGSVNCGILGTSSWTGTYTATSPEGLGVVS